LYAVDEIIKRCDTNHIMTHILGFVLNGVHPGP
jgi:hypothetical protein